MRDTSQVGTAIICCNQYPPRFISGAELVAHDQANTLQSLGWRSRGQDYLQLKSGSSSASALHIEMAP